jgi:plasmid stabilization system protein ParE
MSKPTPLPIIYAAAARVELDEIWDWNEKTFGREHAVKYIEFLLDRVERLSEEYQAGKSVSTRPELLCTPIKLKSRGHFHVVVYQVHSGFVSILHVFHTAQNWEEKLASEAIED